MTIENIDQYIATFPAESQAKMQVLRKTIKKAAPMAEECINYAMPTFKLHGNLVHFAAYKNHIGFYPAPSGIEAFEKELKKFKTSKGAIQFPIDQPIPFELIESIVNFRVKENIEKFAIKLNKKK